MKLKDILILEKSNTSNINLIKDGMFWRAYEKSAFFFSNTIRKYALIKKYFKVAGEEVVYLGFPDSSLEDALKIAESNNLKVEKSGQQVVIRGFDGCNNYDDWKNGVTIYVSAVSGSLAEEPDETVGYSLRSRIMKFPVAERTPIECQQFIIELQNLINGSN